ncbi:glycosyltransferase family 2 protein [Chitinophaga lutea]|uniref:Glycosyltransferase family 2 protein n=1 Tax=Chitinophaga lutea TaxID=2488634 RepID=A0A3N4PI58_9BACT|nr:glycosyltransferase family 2 protein [Chitinophaga lutea]RPE08363.1 glycosyltransferase family 2 protein [Chitinophaga lutea]
MYFWSLLLFISLFIVCYTYAGYGVLLYILVKLKELLFGKRPAPAGEPPVTLLIAAYNEADFIAAKVANTLALDYPEEKLEIIFVTDGSTDATPAILAQHSRIRLLHDAQRSGKSAAINRAMAYVSHPVTVFCDANTLLNPGAIRKLAAHFSDAQVGAVAGEKKVMATADSGAEGAGEGLYWKYESKLKQWDASLYSVMGAAGELFAVRTELYEPIPSHCILDDFIISFRINMRGYTVMYEPGAFATETASASLADEYKRKVRISAGGFQSIGMLLPLLNPFRFPKITFQYISHRVLRWTLAPLCLLLALLANIVLVVQGAGTFFTGLLAAQLLFYGAAFSGYLLARKNVKVKYLYVPFYFVFMNWAVFHGFFRFLGKKQSAVWERSQRRLSTPGV